MGCSPRRPLRCRRQTPCGGSYAYPKRPHTSVRPCACARASCVRARVRVCMRLRLWALVRVRERERARTAAQSNRRCRWRALRSAHFRDSDAAPTRDWARPRNNGARCPARSGRAFCGRLPVASEAAHGSRVRLRRCRRAFARRSGTTRSAVTRATSRPSPHSPMAPAPSSTSGAPALHMRLRMRMHRAAPTSPPEHRAAAALEGFLVGVHPARADGTCRRGFPGLGRRRYDWYKVEGSDPWNALLGVPPPCKTTPARQPWPRPPTHSRPCALP